MKKHRKINIIILCIAILSVLVLFINTFAFSKNSDNGITNMKSGWYYFKDSVKIYISLPTTVYNDTNYFEIYNDNITANDASKIISTSGAQYNLEILANNRRIYKFNDHSMKRNFSVLTKAICLAQLPQGDKQVVTLRYKNTNNGVYELPKVELGSWYSTLINLCRKNAFSLFVTVIMLAMGTVLLVISLMLRRTNISGNKIFFVSIFLVISGVWCLTDSSVVQLFTDYGKGIVYVNFFTMMILPIPLYHYVHSVKNMENYKVFTAYLYLCYANIIFQSVFAICGTFTILQMLPVTHYLLLGGAVLTIIVLIQEYSKTKSHESSICLRAFLMVGVIGGTAIALYTFFGFTEYQTLFQIGVILYVIIIMYYLIEEIIENMRYRTEAEIYRKLSEEDKLTGLKNRRSFDTFLNNIENNSARYKSAMLVFMDVNGLKETNDAYGHSEGDRLIFAAAQCAERAFSSCGFCYRIGGDEFCVIIIDPTDNEETLINRFDSEVESYNCLQTTRCRLSVACGVSYFQKSDGAYKSIEEWKADADKKMYDNKKMKKSIRV